MVLGMLALGIFGILTMGLLGLLSLIAIIWAVIDIAVHQKKEPGWKVIWLIVCIIFGVIGVVVYYFASGRKAKKSKK